MLFNTLLKVNSLKTKKFSLFKLPPTEGRIGIYFADTETYNYYIMQGGFNES